MVARPGPISLPLLAGQNQKVDERLQAPQEFASVVNVVQTRDGRQQPRYGFAKYNVDNIAGGNAYARPIRAVGTGDYFVADQQWNISSSIGSPSLETFTYVMRAGVRSRYSGGSADQGYATAVMQSVNPLGQPSLIPERVMPLASYKGDREQTSSVADVSTYGEWIASCHNDSGAVVVVWRSRDTLEVIASYRCEPTYYGDPTDTTSYLQCSVVCSTVDRSTVVVAVRLSGRIDIIHFGDAGWVPTITNSGVTSGINFNENYCIDTATAGGSTNFAFAYCTGSGGTSYVRCVAFAPTHTLQWQTTIGTGYQYTMHTLDSYGSELLVAYSANDVGGAATYMKAARLSWSTGAATATSATLTSLNAPGIAFCTHKDNFNSGSSWHYLAFTTVSSGIPTANIYYWDGVNASVLSPLFRTNNGVIAGRVFNDDSAQSSAFYAAAAKLRVPMMQSGASSLDTDLAYDPGRPVFIMAHTILYDNIPTEGNVQVMGRGAGSGEAGLLALSGEVGQATHPSVSGVYAGTNGFTIGAPTKCVRVRSNSGDHDTGLTDAYVMTFDVAIPGKSRRFAGAQWQEALINLPRQGRLALFKPMMPQECELRQARENEVLVPGLTANVCDGQSTHSCGFLEAPVISSLTSVVSTKHPPGAGTYSITAVFEWVDSAGRRYQSAPSVPRDITLLAGEQAVIDFARPVAGYSYMSIAIYRTVAGGSIFQRDGSVTAGNVSSIRANIALSDNQLLAQETLYTSLGEVPNDPPPSAQRFARTKDRVWAYGLDRREVVQASKLLVDGRGIVWSNAANYFAVLPDPVVAVAELDETAVVFTERGVYTLGGSGPDDTGIGTFSDPGRIPGYVGCVSAKSVISADAGIYFQSQRGIEMLPRGFDSPQWIGQPVMTDLETYTQCRGVTADASGDRIVWCMVNPDDWTERLLVLDCRAQTWSIWDAGQLQVSSPSTYNTPTAGLSVGGENPVRGYDKPARIVLWGSTEALNRIQSTDSCQDRVAVGGGAPTLTDITTSWETGWMRFAGTNGWVIIRRLGLLMTPVLADGWVITVVVAYDDDESNAYTFTFDSGDISYGFGDSKNLEIALPVVQFQSIKVTISVDSGVNGPWVQLHSVALYPESEGVRLRAANRR